MPTLTATFVRKLDGFNGDARLYRLSHPIAKRQWDNNAEPVTFDYVVASAADVMWSGPETYLFGADESGKVLDWTELPGSFKGDLDHAEALRNAGFEVAL